MFEEITIFNRDLESLINARSLLSKSKGDSEIKNRLDILIDLIISLSIVEVNKDLTAAMKDVVKDNVRPIK